MSKSKVYPNTEWQKQHNARCLWEVKGPGSNIPWITCYAEAAGITIITTFRDGTYAAYYGSTTIEADRI